MTARSIALLLFAGCVAFGTALMVRNYIHTNSAASGKGSTEVTRVLVAASDIAPGSFIRTDQHLQWVDWPNENVNAAFLIEGKAKLENYNGAVARRQIMKGEPMTDDILVKSSEGGFMAAVLKPGLRAVSIAVDSTTGNAGFIFPGDKVDLIVTHSVKIAGTSGEGREESLASETFIEDVRVLAVDQKLDNPEKTAILAKTVTLEVSQRQAEKINVAKDMGKISLSLRSLANNDQPRIERHATRDSDVSAVMAPPAASAVAKVVVIRGAEREELEFGH